MLQHVAASLWERDNHTQSPQKEGLRVCRQRAREQWCTEEKPEECTKKPTRKGGVRRDGEQVKKERNAVHFPSLALRPILSKKRQWLIGS